MGDPHHACEEQEYVHGRGWRKSGSRKRGGPGAEPKYVLGDDMMRQGHASASETWRGGYMKWLGGAC